MDTPQPVKVLAVLGDPRSGVGYVRFELPFRDLDGYEIDYLGSRLTLERRGDRYVPQPTLLDGVQMLIFPQMVAAPQLPGGDKIHLVEPLCDLAARRNVPVVYSVDDDLQALDPRNPGLDSIREAEENLRQLLERADAYIVTTEPLKQALATHGKPTFVLPNTVDPQDWTTRPESHGDGPLRIGFAGSSSHLDDLAFVLPALRKLRSKVDFSFHLLGLTDRSIAEELDGIRSHSRDFSEDQRDRARLFREIAEQLEELHCDHTPFQDVGRYRANLAALDLDLGLCPLLDTSFNRCKSALKFYEYAMVGTPAIASDVVPFRGEMSPTVPNDVNSWVDCLQELAGDPDRRRRLLNRQRSFVLDHRLRAAWADRWSSSLENILTGRSVPATVS